MGRGRCFWVILLVVVTCGAPPADAGDTPAWRVKRDGQPRALASPTRGTVTADMLASQLHLDEADAARWAAPQDLGVLVPNTSVVAYGAAVNWDDPYPWVFRALRTLADQRRADDEAAGYHVVVLRDARDDEIVLALEQMSARGELARFAFVGHGDGGIINTTGADAAGVPPMAYTRYGLSDVALWTCGALRPSPFVVPFVDEQGRDEVAAPATVSLWQHNVAVSGSLSGYRRDTVRPWNTHRFETLAGLRPRSRPE